MSYTDQDVERMRAALVRAYESCYPAGDLHKGGVSSSVNLPTFARALLDEGVKPPPPPQRERDEKRLAELVRMDAHQWTHRNFVELAAIARRALAGYPEDQR